MLPVQLGGALDRARQVRDPEARSRSVFGHQWNPRWFCRHAQDDGCDTQYGVFST